MNPLACLPAGLTALTRLRVLEMYYVRLASSGEADVARLQCHIPGLFVFSNAAPAAPGGRVRAAAALPMDGPPEGEDGAAVQEVAGDAGGGGAGVEAGAGSSDTSDDSGSALLGASLGAASSASSSSGRSCGAAAGARAAGGRAASGVASLEDPGSETDDLGALLDDMGLEAPGAQPDANAERAAGSQAHCRAVAAKQQRASGGSGGCAGSDDDRDDCAAGGSDQGRRRAGHAAYTRAPRRRTEYGD
jgi:hypothetical protein